MPSFRLSEIESVEFGVCYRDGDVETFALLPTDEYVKEALIEVLSTTLNSFAQQFDVYEPAQHYASRESLRIRIRDPLVVKLRNLFRAENLEVISGSLRDLDKLFYYFVIFRDKDGKKLIATRLASHFKGEVRKRLIGLVDDTLTMVGERVFKLDKEFDVIIGKSDILILNPRNFERTADIQDKVLEQAVVNTRELSRLIKFVDFVYLADYVTSRMRAARLVASLRIRSDLVQTSRKLVIHACDEHEIVLENPKSARIQPSKGHEMNFLKVLDRRRYTVTLVDGVIEKYEALNRKGV